MNANNIIEELKKLEDKLRKDIREDAYFGDSYVCGIADHLYQLQQQLKEANNKLWISFLQSLLHIFQASLSWHSSLATTMPKQKTNMIV